jgi:hypothetical protein
MMFAVKKDKCMGCKTLIADKVCLFTYDFIGGVVYINYFFLVLSYRNCYHIIAIIKLKSYHVKVHD